MDGIDVVTTDLPQADPTPKPSKIAILGSAPSSRMLAPFGNKDWTIWATSPANVGCLPRVDVWFEIHAVNIIRAPDIWPGMKDYIAWLNAQPFEVLMCDENDLVPRAKSFPWVQLVHKYGPHFFTSSCSWMLAFAIEHMLAERTAHPELASEQKIMLFGVDMAANGEFEYQRPGCHHFMQVCRDNGINVEVPGESDLWRPPPLYGVTEGSPMTRKLTLHGQELNQRLDEARKNFGNTEREMFMLQGALAEHAYFMRTWVD